MKMNQPTNMPTNKVTAAGVAGAASILVVYLASLAGVNIPAEVASALTTVMAFGAGYLTREEM